MPKFALGLHHLNIAYVAGNIDSYHRQVREAVTPFLSLLDTHPSWRFTVEMAGYSLEFLADNYPQVLKKLRQLTAQGRLELISATYSPQLWIAFPKRDMVKSTEINRQLLHQYGLPVSRIFFAQENFAGEGITELKEYFDTAVIKDDYYFYLHQAPGVGSSLPPYYSLGEMKLLVGWGHILESMANRVLPELPSPALQQDAGLKQQELIQKQNWLQRLKRRFSTAKAAAGQSVMSQELSRQGIRVNGTILDEPAQNMLLKARQRQLFGSPMTFRTSQYADVEWTWYHMGSGERYATPATFPADISRYYYNPHWLQLAEQCLMEYEDQGYQLATISEFLDAIEITDFKPPMCEPLIDGNWNMQKGKGCFTWLGWNRDDAQNDLAVRSHNWRSRSRLVQIENDIENASLEADKLKSLRSDLNGAWKHQLLAEVSDSTGWFPTQQEVWFGLNESDIVLNQVARIQGDLQQLIEKKHPKSEQEFHVESDENATTMNLKPTPTAEAFAENLKLVGAQGRLKLFTLDTQIQRLFVDFQPNASVSGIQFDLQTDNLIYSPALMEHQIVQYPLENFKPSVLYLPLVNGIIGINENTYLIKHNTIMHIACAVHITNKSVQFVIENPKPVSMQWIFTLFHGAGDDAVQLALQINSID